MESFLAQKPLYTVEKIFSTPDGKEMSSVMRFSQPDGLRKCPEAAAAYVDISRSQVCKDNCAKRRLQEGCVRGVAHM